MLRLGNNAPIFWKRNASQVEARGRDRSSDGFRSDTEAAAQFLRKSSSFRPRSRCSTKSACLPAKASSAATEARRFGVR